LLGLVLLLQEQEKRSKTKRRQNLYGADSSTRILFKNLLPTKMGKVPPPEAAHHKGNEKTTKPSKSARHAEKSKVSFPAVAIATDATSGCVAKINIP
jgi:hypothetical protein